ncbi:MAG TPA: hypothetical protein VM677_11465 [Actinokineospora sp.]|jgi:hypothetical protein|nr:hypothetical protein [Actinokineospora sp.]
MSRYLRARIFMAALSVLTLPLVVAGAATADRGQVQPGPGGKYQDYLGSTAMASGTGADQCGVEPSKRKGNWVCLDAKDKPVQTFRPNGINSSYCISGNCWNRYSDLQADASISGNWGYGGTILGHVDLYVSYNLAGAETWSKPVQYKNSRATTNVILTGDLINAAPGATGSQVPGKFSLYQAGNIPPGLTRSWAPNGYKSYDNTMWDHSQVHQWSWNTSGYSGYWYAYIKSISTHTPDKVTYRFYSVNQLPANAYGAGWRA